MESNYMVGIYIIKNITNNKVYVGKSVNIVDRVYNKHIKCLKNNIHINGHLQNSWNKYGEYDFTFDILEICDKELLNEREKYWIKLYNSIDDKYGYNKRPGGDGGSMPGQGPMKDKKHSNETKEKISKKLKGRKISIEHKENIGKTSKEKSKTEKGKIQWRNVINNNRGKICSKETKKKISEKCKGYKHTDEAKKKISETGKNRSQEIIDKIATKNKGKTRSEETKRKQSEAAKGRKVSEETKKKISETLKNKNKK